MKVAIFYITADTTEEFAQTRINEWLEHCQDTITILYILQSSEDDDTIISIWYNESTHVV